MWKSKRVRELEAENVGLVMRLQGTEERLSKAVAKIAHLNAEHAEEIEKREKVCADLAKVNRRLREEKNEAMEALRRSLDKYRELRDRVEKLAHRVEEMTGEMVGSVHEL